MAAGATAATGPAEVAASAETIVTMLPNNSIVSGVYEGDQGLLSTVKEGTLLVDSSTVDPALSKHLAAQVEWSTLIGRDCPDTVL